MILGDFHRSQVEGGTRTPSNSSVTELAVDVIGHGVQLLISLPLRVREKHHWLFTAGQALSAHSDQPNGLKWPLVKDAACRLPQISGGIGRFRERRGAGDGLEIPIPDLQRHTASMN